MHNSYVYYILYIVQCNGKGIKWNHLEELYLTDTTPGNGLRLVPKLRYEHINLTTFSKMSVDLAAQVNMLYVNRTYLFYVYM